MNTEVLFSSKSDMWETPEFFSSLDKEFHFTLDVCAVPENAKCDRYYTPLQDGLSQPWRGVVWCNPPYGRSTYKWVHKAYESSIKHRCTVVMLLPARTDTRWFHDYIYLKRNVEIRFIKGRLKFGGSRNSAPFPSMVVVFRGTKKLLPIQLSSKYKIGE